MSIRHYALLEVVAEGVGVLLVALVTTWKSGVGVDTEVLPWSNACYNGKERIWNGNRSFCGCWST